MGSFIYELPTTGAISFTDFCLDENGLYTAHIVEVTQARANLRGALKEIKRDTSGEKDYLKLAKVIDEYLPQLYGVLACVEQGQLQLKSEPVFSWRTTLSANRFHTSPRLNLHSFYAELASTLLTYAFALSNLSRSSVSSLGQYERERGISDIERKAKDEKLNFAVSLLCRASGIFSHISERVLVDWDKHDFSATASSSNVSIRPPDLSREVTSALAKMALADAQTLAIRKLLSRAAYDSTISPGPPLPKSHPSPSLIAKLHLECAFLYSSARTLAKTPSEEVNGELRKYLKEEAGFHGALGRKWLGVDCGETGGTEKGGDAVAWTAWAKKELEELKGNKGIGISRTEKEKRKDKFADELESTTVFWKHYTKVNDSLHFQTVPPQSALQSRIPEGRLAVAVKPYELPMPVFGPGSVKYAQKQAEELELELGQEKDESVPSPRVGGSYAGARSYF